MAAAVAANAITFTEFPVGTQITDQYRDRGLAFGGDSPFISTDGSNPTSPVLSGTPQFVGQIEIKVVDPDTGRDSITDGLDLDVGYIDSRNSVEIAYFDPTGRQLGAVRANALGINTIHLPLRGIHRVVVRATEDEPAGFAIDNVARDTVTTTVHPTRSIGLGDSYTSGEGLRSYDCGTDMRHGTYYENTTVLVGHPTPPREWCDTATGQPLPLDPSDQIGSRPKVTYQNLCHRGGGAWPNQVRQRLGITGPNSLFIACSGAKAHNIGFLTPESANAPQYPLSPRGVAGGEVQKKNADDFVEASGPVDLVTIGVGGNDAGFSDIIETCLRYDCLDHNGYTTSTIANINASVYPKLVQTFTEVRAHFAGATVLTYGYPSVVSPDTPTCRGARPLGIGWQLSPDERRWARDELLPTLNEAVADAAAAAGITYMPIDEVTRGHEICSEHEWINGISSGQENAFGLVGNESFHPKKAAHDAIANYFIEHYTDGAGGLTFSNPTANPNIRPAPQPITLRVGHVEATPQGQCGQQCLQPVCTPTSCALHLELDNFSPDAELQVTLHSDPVDLGTVRTDADGHAVLDAEIPDSVPDGLHGLDITGQADGVEQLAAELVNISRIAPVPLPCEATEAGCDNSTTTTIPGDSNGGGSGPGSTTSTTRPTSSGHLPRTGSDIGPIIRFAIVLLLIGATAVATARVLRRRARRAQMQRHSSVMS